MLENELRTAKRLARDAGAAILEIFDSDFTVEEKQVTQHYSEPVTLADTTSSALIVKGLAAEFPEDAILSEEEVDETEKRLASERVWIVDPLDGTKGFTEGLGDFAVQIGLVDNGKPVVGVVFQPIGDVMYTAVSGNGAFVSIEGGAGTRLQTSDLTEFNEMTVAVSRSHRSRFMERIFDHFEFRDEYRHGSVGLKVGFLARKTADVYIHPSPHTKYWDTAAPEVILAEAGGLLTDIFGQKIDYQKKDVRNHNGIFASNGRSHQKAVRHLQPLLTEFGRVKVIG